MAGDKTDDESGLSHISHAICSLMFVLELQLKDQGKEASKDYSYVFDSMLKSLTTEIKEPCRYSRNHSTTFTTQG
jgi:hypothetical protein